MSEGEPETEVLDVEATRPPLVPFIGIPLGLAVLYGAMAFVMSNIFHQTVLGIGLALMLTAFSAILIRRDYNGVRIFGIYCRLGAQWLQQRKMHGLSVSHWGMR